MAFKGPDEILVLEKDSGTVRRIENGVILQEPLLDLNVENRAEGGMLGIAVAHDHNLRGEKNRESNSSYVFLYFTKGETRDGEDNRQVDGDKTFRNSMYRYQLVNNNTKPHKSQAQNAKNIHCLLVQGVYSYLHKMGRRWVE